ncbi:MAG: IS1595 family transposase [Chloroflexi bacterium]|nr:IS1595 family transposase [Chloroflexota bacterium]
MASGKFPLRKWPIAAYFLYTARKGMSSIRLSKLIDVTQKLAWFLLHRLCAAITYADNALSGIVEVGETYISGSDRNRHADKKHRAILAPARRRCSACASGRCREAENVAEGCAFWIPDASGETLHGAINAHVARESTIYSDDWEAYRGLAGYWHAWVRHSPKEYVQGDTHTNGFESFWALLKRGHKAFTTQ